MLRLGLLLACALLLLALPAGVAAAQDPSAPRLQQAPDDAMPQPQDAPDDGVLDDGEIPPESTPDPGDEDGCTPGADGDYGYCGQNDCPVQSPDSDYAYCVPQPANRGEGAGSGPGAEVRSISSGQLPLTGPSAPPLLLALVGAGFLCLGTGLKLTLDARRPPA